MSLEIEVNPLQNVFDLVNAQAEQEAKVTESAQVVIQPDKTETVVTQADEVSESTDTQTTDQENENNKVDKAKFNAAVFSERTLRKKEVAIKDAEIEQLRLENESLKQSKTNQDEDYTSDDELDELEQELPEVSKKLRALQSDNKAKTEKLKQLEQAKFDDVNSQLLAIRQQRVAEAFNDNPKLVHIKENMPELWDYAQERDALIGTLPEYANASFEKRFADVIALVELKHGVIELPNNETNKTDSKIALPKKVTKNDVPTSLTDIAGKAIATERPTLATASKGQVREMFRDKTSDEIMAAIRNS